METRCASTFQGLSSIPTSHSTFFNGSLFFLWHKCFEASWREVHPRALYPFGFGLSYTSFAFARPQLSTAALGWDEALEVTVEVTNTGQRAGEEAGGKRFKASPVGMKLWLRTEWNGC